MSTTDATAWAPDHAAASPLAAPPGRSLGDPLGVLIEHLRAHPRVCAAVFLVVDPEGRHVEVAASWFGSPPLREALEAALARPYDRSRPGLTEGSLGRDRPLFLPRIEAWESAPLLREQVERMVDPARRARAWEALRVASVIGCPVHTTLGHPMGVLIVASTDPLGTLRRSDVDTVEVLADLAALARERSDLLAAEAGRARDELLLKRAAEGTAGSLETGEVARQAVRHSLHLVRADWAVLTRAGSRPRVLATAGDEPEGGEGGIDAAGLAAVVRSRRTLRAEGAPSALHVPVQLGPRLFGVLSVLREANETFGAREVGLVEAVARMAAAAMANAADFDRERRTARALTRGFVPPSPPEVEGFEMGFLYEPADEQAAGGDLYGTWRLPSGEVAVLVGDVSGKGVEAAALSSMARFFIEARSWDCADPAAVLAQAGRMLHERLPADTFVTASLGLLDRGGRLRYANAGHPRALLLSAGGEVSEVSGAGLPLGVARDPAYETHALHLAPGDLVLGYTDGLIEAQRGGQLLGPERLAEIVRTASSGAAGAQDLVRVVHADVREWAGSLGDDVVLLGLRRARQDL